MNWIDSLNSWIVEHQAVIAIVGVPLLTLVVTALVSYFTVLANNNAQDRQRELSHQLKLAEFRQSWINDMREDFAIYTARTWSEALNKGPEAQKELLVAQARILMRMNPSDPDYDSILCSLRSPIAHPESEKKALFEIGQRVLKREWERLKDDLNAVGKSR